ncbi:MULTISPECIES: glycosyltransferase [Gammaproteobacteria]|uniref:glycosyltransferase n=1 Tax=Gammaproteobacteria TaxID=1236 RepID=UPI003A91C174
MFRPALTVVVTSYNYSRYISRCVESILEQDFSDFELIILDNDSTDETVRAISPFLLDNRVRLVRHDQNIGAYFNFSLALGVGFGKYLSIVSADDYLLPGHFSRLIAALQESSSVLAYTPIMLVDKDGIERGVQRHPGYAVSSYRGGRDDFLGLLAFDCYVTLCAVIFDREKARSELYFDVNSWGGGDWELFVRLALKYKDFSFESTPSACYRIHDSQYSSTCFYSSLEPLYTHLAILEKYADHLLERADEACIHTVTTLLRSRMAQYERALYDHANNRLQQLLDKLEGRSIAEAGAVLVVFDATADYIGSLEKLAIVGSSLRRNYEFLVVCNGQATFTIEMQKRIRLLLSGDVSFVSSSVHSALAKVDHHIRHSSVENVLYIGQGCPIDPTIIVSGVESLEDSDFGLICFNGGIAQEGCLPAHWGEGEFVRGMLFRKSLYVKVGGFNPIMYSGGVLWDFILRVLRFNALGGGAGGLLASDPDSTSRSLDVLGDLAWAQLVFGNTIFFDTKDIKRAATTLLRESKQWLPVVCDILEQQPLASAANFMRMLAPIVKDAEHECLFSIILTTYNRQLLLKDALQGISQQTFRNFEVVLVNDSGDPVESLLAVHDFPITYIRQGCNRGPAAARNAGLHLAQGRYVVYLDDDDRYLATHLQTLAQAVEAWPDEVVYTDAIFITESLVHGERLELAREQRYSHDEYSKERLLVNNYIPINTFTCSRSLAASIGGFDESLTGLEDWDFLLRLAARARFRHVHGETVEVRLRDVESDPVRRSEQALKDYPGLYRELYTRHSDLGSEAVRSGRRAMLKRFGISDLSTNHEPASLTGWLEMRVLTPTQERLVKERLEQNGQGPSFGVLLLDLEADRQEVLRTLASLREPHNLYANIEPVVFTTSDSLAEPFGGPIINVTKANWILQLNEFLATAKFDWLVLVKAGDEFTSAGLLMAGLELLGAAPDFRAIYCDELYRQDDGSLGAAFRPSMNLDYLLSFPAGMAQHWIFRREVLVDVGGFNPDYPEALEFELILRFINTGGLAGLGHVDEPLLITSPPALINVEDEQRVVIQHLHERGYQGASIDSSLPGRYLINYGHADKPLVSILISVKDQLPMLLRCVTSVMENTRYANYEILLLDDSRASREVREWLNGIESMAEQRIRVLRFPEEAGLDAICNQAADVAQGEYLVLLSQCCAVISEAWLDEMLNHALRPEVGIVGSELINKESTISHAGLVLGLRGPATSPFVGEALSAAGYMQRLQVEQNYSAVSSDCLMVSKELWGAIGGLDEGELSGTLAGVDLCLRAREAGFLTVWSPRVKMMIGREPKAPTVDEADALYAKWLPLLARDPAYNANFSLVQPGGFKLADTALSWRPLATWRPLPVVLAHPADQFGCGHYRIMQPFKAQQDAGLIDGALSMGLMHVADLERYDPDVILLQRQIGEERLESMRRMKAFSRAFKVYELDDYLPNLPMKSAHKQHMPKDIVKSLRRGLSYVDRFVVSTEALADAFSAFHHDIRVAENKLPPNWWQGLQGQRRISKRPRVGWAGGAGHTGDLELIADVVKALADEVDWIFFGMCPEKLRPYVKEFHAGVEISLYPAALARLNLDLALAPLEQNLFNECKSNLRLLEYGACGFPVICSDVGNYRGGLPVTRVKNRFRDWVDAIRMHLADLDATARQGDELRSAVLSGWMLQDAALADWYSAWLPNSH